MTAVVSEESLQSSVATADLQSGSLLTTPAHDALQPTTHLAALYSHSEPTTDNYLWRPRWIYGSTFAWIACVGGRFLAPFLEQESSLTATQIGLCLGLQASIVTLCGPSAGKWADKAEATRVGGRTRVMAMGICMGTLCFLGHVALPSNSRDEADDTSPVMPILLQCAFAISVAFVYPVMDGITLDFLENMDTNNTQGKAAYGPERLWGAITWAIVNVVISICLDRFGFASLYPLGILATMGELIVLRLYQSAQVKHAHVKSATCNTDRSNGKSISRKVSSSSAMDNDDSESTKIATHMSWQQLCAPLWSTWYALAFIFAIVCLASGQAVVDSLIFLYFEFLGSSYALMGLTVVLTVAFEIPIFQMAPQILERYGPEAMLIVAGLAYVTRVLAYSIIPQGHVAYVLVLEPLHGITYACSQSAVVDFIAKQMPAGYEASGQGLVYLFRGIGGTVGVLLGGWAVDSLGPRYMYRTSAGVVAFGISAFVLSLTCDRYSQDSVHPLAGQHERLAQDEETSSSMGKSCIEMGDQSRSKAAVACYTDAEETEETEEEEEEEEMDSL
jgi:MFS family permease